MFTVRAVTCTLFENYFGMAFHDLISILMTSSNKLDAILNLNLLSAKKKGEIVKLFSHQKSFEYFNFCI